MKFSAEKAGKKAKCPKCGTLIVIRVDEEPAVPPPEPAPEKVPNEFDDDGPASYGVAIDPEMEQLRLKRIEEEENQHKKKKERKALPKVTRKIKAIPEAEAWIKVRIGLLFVFIGCWIWLASHLLQGSYVLLGSIEFAEFANLNVKNLAVRNGGLDVLPPKGQAWNMDYLNIYLEMIAGRDIVGYAKVALTTGTVIYFLQSVLWLAGYGFFMPIPRRFGMFSQALILIGLGLFNMLFMFLFKLLPVVGVHGYVLIPYVTPEITMTVYNMERMVPIHVLWSGAPFWESILVIFALFMHYLEPTFGCILIWTIGVAIKSPEMEKSGRSLTSWSLGTFFILVCFHLLSLCGASPVMVILLRFVYALWFFFMILMVLRYAMLIMKLRAVLEEKINPKNELQD